MPSIRSVTVAGITGALGPDIVSALVEAGFVVQAFTRHTNTPKPHLQDARIVEVDYSDSVALTRLLRGQDAVISTLGDTAGAYAAQRALIEASFAAGVKRFVPSEFGSDTSNPKVKSMPFFREKIRHQELLMSLAATTPNFSYSLLVTGPFLDWGLSVVPFIIDVGSKSTQLFDGGDVPFSFTRVSTVARAVVRVLEIADATVNRTLFVHDSVTTQKVMLDRAEALLAGQRFAGVVIDIAKLELDAWRAFHDTNADPMSWVFSFINLSIWSWDGGRGICEFRETDNALLGIDELRDGDIEDTIDCEILKAANTFAARAAQGESHGLSAGSSEMALEGGRSKLIGFA